MKIWTSTEMFTESQSVKIQPSEVFDGITLQFKESEAPGYGHYLYLTKNEMKHLIKMMEQMMEYVEEAK